MNHNDERGKETKDDSTTTITTSTKQGLHEESTMVRFHCELWCSVAPSDFDSENFCSEIPNGIGKATEFRSEFRFFFKFRKKSSENIFRNINRNSEFCYNSEKIPKIPHILHSFDNVFNIK